MRLEDKDFNLRSMLDKKYNVKKPGPPFLVDNYRCNHCDEIWNLSKNEKHWVGFFVKFDWASGRRSSRPDGDMIAGALIQVYRHVILVY